jgi:drug/metabolite transporter (DMT)-like permease
MPESPRRPALTLGLLAGIAAVSTASIFIRFAQSDGAPSLVIAAARMSLAALGLAPIALTRYRAELGRMTRREWLLALLSGLFLALHFASWITSLQFTSVASSVVLVTTTPLWVALAAPLVLRERLGRGAALGLALALVGSAVVGVSDSCAWEAGRLLCPSMGEFLGKAALRGDFLALFGAWMAAGYLLVGRKLRTKLDLIPYIFVVYAMSALLLLTIVFAVGERLTGYPGMVYVWFILLAAVPQLFGHSIFNWALKYLPASLVSVTLLGEPIGSTVLAVLLLGEMPSWMKIAGGLTILFGIWLTARNQRPA